MIRGRQSPHARTFEAPHPTSGSGEISAGGCLVTTMAAASISEKITATAKAKTTAPFPFYRARKWQHTLLAYLCVAVSIS